MRKIMIVVGHPLHNTFCEALAKAYRDAAGHEASLFMLADMTFDPILHEGFRKAQQLDLRVAYGALASCDHLVLIFPLWCGDMPALMKGFIERILHA
jgi:putative NADPH-quinone reductase